MWTWLIFNQEVSHISILINTIFNAWLWRHHGDIAQVTIQVIMNRFVVVNDVGGTSVLLS